MSKRNLRPVPLEASVANWRESAKFDRRQIRQSFVGTGLGFLIGTTGGEVLVSGDFIPGLVLIGLGVVATGGFARAALSEIDDYAESMSQAAVWQHELDKVGHPGA